MIGGTDRAEFEINETSDIVSFKMYDVVEELKYLHLLTFQTPILRHKK